MPFKRPTTTPTPDELFDEWLVELGEAELKILLYIIRRTMGFKKNADAISYKQFLHGITTRDGRVLDRGCGVRNRTNLARALTRLEERTLIRSWKRTAHDGDADVTVYALRFEGEEEQEDEQPHSDPAGTAFWEPRFPKRGALRQCTPLSWRWSDGETWWRVLSRAVLPAKARREVAILGTWVPKRSASEARRSAGMMKTRHA